MLIQITNHLADAANDRKIQRNRTVPIPESITTVAGLPNKLVVFKMDASKYWQVRCFFSGRTYRRSTKTTSLKQAQRFARWFYEELLIPCRCHVFASRTTLQNRHACVVLTRSKLQTNYRTTFNEKLLATPKQNQRTLSIPSSTFDMIYNPRSTGSFRSRFFLRWRDH